MYSRVIKLKIQDYLLSNPGEIQEIFDYLSKDLNGMKIVDSFSKLATIANEDRNNPLNELKLITKNNMLDLMVILAMEKFGWLKRNKYSVLFPTEKLDSLLINSKVITLHEGEKIPLLSISDISNLMKNNKAFYYDFRLSIKNEEDLKNSLIEVNLTQSRVENIKRLFQGYNAIIIAREKVNYLNQVFNFRKSNKGDFLENIEIVNFDKSNEILEKEKNNFQEETTSNFLSPNKLSNIKIDKTQNLKIFFQEKLRKNIDVKNLIFNKIIYLNIDNSHLLKNVNPLGIFKLGKKEKFVVFRLMGAHLFWSIGRNGLLWDLEAIKV